MTKTVEKDKTWDKTLHIGFKAVFVYVRGRAALERRERTIIHSFICSLLFTAMYLFIHIKSVPKAINTF